MATPNRQIRAQTMTNMTALFAIHSRQGGANSAPARSTTLMTLGDSRHGSDVWHRRLTAFCMHTSRMPSSSGSRVVGPGEPVTKYRYR